MPIKRATLPPCRSDSKIKELKEKLLKGKGQPNLSKVDDIHVICCVLKDFLRELKEPLVTFDLHGAFTLAAGEIPAHLNACMWVKSVLFRVSSLQHHSFDVVEAHDFNEVSSDVEPFMQ